MEIFDHHGNKIHEAGSFADLCGIALDPIDGSVYMYVADCYAISVLYYMM